MGEEQRSQEEKAQGSLHQEEELAVTESQRAALTDPEEDTESDEEEDEDDDFFASLTPDQLVSSSESYLSYSVVACRNLFVNDRKPSSPNTTLSRRSKKQIM